MSPRKARAFPHPLTNCCTTYNVLCIASPSMDTVRECEEQGGIEMSVAFETPVSFGVGGHEDLLIAELRVGEGIRSGGLDERHVELLMECADTWPPIVVWGDDLVVVDGCHRVEAARRLGHLRVVGLRFLGSPEEAFIEAIRRNVSHGLPLSVADRRRAARRVLLRNPNLVRSAHRLSVRPVRQDGRENSACRVVGDRRGGPSGRARWKGASGAAGRGTRSSPPSPGGESRGFIARHRRSGRSVARDCSIGAGPPPDERCGSARDGPTGRGERVVAGDGHVGPLRLRRTGEPHCPEDK